MSRIRVRVLCLAAVGAALCAGHARASGTIVTTGAAVAAGTAPTAGTVTTDACARRTSTPTLPDIPPLGTIGSMTGSLPAFGGGGAGGLGAFTATANVTLPAGAYEYSTFTVNAGVTVTCLGAVTIRTTGSMTLNGALVSTLASTPITVQCGGDLSINNSSAGGVGGVVARIETQGVSSPVGIDVAGNISLSSTATGRGAGILVTDGDLDITAQKGMNFYASAAVVASSLVQSQHGDVRVRCSLDLFTGSAFVNAFSGSVLIQSFGGDVLLGGASASGNVVAIGGGVRVEAAHAAIASRGTSESHGGDLVFLAFGGSMTVQNNWSLDSYGAQLVVGASAGVVVLDTAGIRGHGTSDVEVTAYGGGIRLGDVGTQQTPEIVQVSSGPVGVRASGDIAVNARGRIVTPSGDLTIASVGGNIRQDGDTATTATGGALDVRASGSIIAARNSATGGTKPTFSGESVVLRAGAGGIALDVDQVAAASGACTTISGGTVVVGGPLTAAGPLTVRSIDGSVSLSGQSISTSSTGAGSGAIVVESYAGAKGIIDATNAIVRSGNDPVASGDVTLAVYMSDPGPVDGFVLPSKVSIKVDRGGDPAKSVLTASGVLDTGARAANLAGAATLQVGTISTAVNLVADKKGKLRSKDASLDLQIVPPKSGTSKAAFTLKQTGDFGALAGPAGAGTLDIRFTNAAVDCPGSVVLAAGRYSSGKKPGTIAGPGLRPVSVTAAVKGGGLDRILATFAFTTDGTVPATPPDVVLSFGDRYRLAIPASSFSLDARGRFVATKPATAVASVIIDYRRETVTIDARGTPLVLPTPATPGHGATPGHPARPFDLGTFAGGPSLPVAVGVSFGTDERSVKFRLSRNRLVLTY